MRALRTAVVLLAVIPWIGTAAAWADLTGYWPLETLNPGSTFDDASGNGHVATIAGSGTVTAAGHFGNALQFTGDINDRLLVSPVVDLGSQWTLSAWAKNFWASSTWRTLFRGSNLHHPVLVQNGTSALGTYNNSGGGFYPSGHAFAPGSGPDGWDHVVAVGELGSTSFYVNGQYVGTSAFQSTDNVGSIGNNYTAGQKFSELLDDVATWDEPLRINQVQALYSGAAAPPTLPGASPLVGWWKFDEAAGTQAADSTGNGFSGTPTGTYTWQPAGGKIDGAIQLGGTSPDRVVLDRPVDLGDTWTISTWFNGINGPGNWRTLARGRDGDHQILIENTGWQLGTYRNASPAGFFGTGFDMSPYATGWHHLAAVGQDGRTDFFVDGVYAGTAGFQSTTDVQGVGNIHTGTQPFGEYLDDFTIFNQPLGGPQVRALFREDATPDALPTSHLVGWWKLDGPDGATAGTVLDSSGYHYDGQVNNSTGQWVAGGRLGGALEFTDGQSDVILLDDHLDLGDEWTIGGWFKKLLPAAQYRTMARGQDGDHQILVKNDGSHELGVYDNSSLGWVGTGYSMAPLLDLDEWHHIAAVGLEGQTLFYIDGEWVGTAAFQSTTDVKGIGNHWQLNQKFAEFLDDVVVYDVALSPTEVQHLARGFAADHLIPEPAAWLLAMTAGLGLSMTLRRRRRNAVR